MANRGCSRRNDKDVNLSKSLSWLLRHGAEKEGLELDDSGFGSVQKILQMKQFRNYTADDVKRVVDNNDKRRFSLRSGANEGELFIRANQGHSLPVSAEHLLTPLTPESVPPRLYHGTYIVKLDSILEHGLHRMNRNHVHFAAGLPGDAEVLSGMRSDCNAYVVVDALQAMKEGLQFFKSENGVVLTPGNDNGFVPPSTFIEVQKRCKKSSNAKSKIMVK